MSLPLSRPGRRSSRSKGGLRVIQLGRKTEITQRGVVLRLETTALNGAHDVLGDILTRREMARGRLVRSFYDVGALVGVTGLLGGLGTLLWSAIQISASLAAGSEHASAIPTNRTIIPVPHSRISSSDLLYNSPSDVMLRPIIPGITVPFFHLPVILLALFSTQIFHEVGHALAAAADAVPMIAAGFSLAFAIPNAFVALPNSISSFDPENASSTRVKLRIATAGAWHNILLWVFLLLLAQSGILPHFWTFFGYGLYKDMSHDGPVAVSVVNDSPLQSHIPIGSIITRLDDTRLAHVDNARDIWDQYLNSPQAHDTLQGWCVSRSWYKVQTSTCCQSSSEHPTDNGGLCFVPPPISNSSHPDSHLAFGRCVDPVTLFLSTKEALDAGEAPLSTSRCESVCMQDNAKGPEICIRPRKEVELLRIGITLPPWEVESTGRKATTVIWSGPREEVWDQVSVGNLRPRFWWLPAYLPIWIDLLLRYLETITLSLFIFNLLPIPMLDGAQVLSLTLDLIMRYVAAPKVRDVGFELLEKGQIGDGDGETLLRAGDTRKNVEMIVTLSSGVLMAVVCTLSLVREVIFHWR